MTDRSSIRTARDDRLWRLLGAVELTYHPALALAALLIVDVAASPVPVVTFHPLSVALAGRGVPVTTCFAGIVLVDLAADVAGTYVAGRGERDE